MDKRQDRMEFLEFCWDLAERRLGSITSGGRTRKRNAQVGGHELSKHLFGPCWAEACDIVFDTGEQLRGAAAEVMAHPRYVYNMYPERLQLHVQGWPVGKTAEDYEDE